MACSSKVFTFVTMMLAFVTSTPTMSRLKQNVLWFEVGPVMRNCKDIQKNYENNASGVYTIYPYKCCPDSPVKVYCDMETNGGGWTVIQRRDNIEPREDFYRTWMEYALGFGDLTGEFWLGLDNIHALTDQTLYEIRFDLTDFNTNTRWAEYKFFYIHDRSLLYKLEVNGYTGDAGDSFTSHNGALFSAKDVDQDEQSHDCAASFKGAWWYGVSRCHYSNINGFYHHGQHDSFADGVDWETWLGYNYSLKKTEMKIRPAF